MATSTYALLSSCLLLAAACGGDDGGSTTIDAPAGPDAQSSVMISGIAQTVSGTSTAPLAGAAIEAFNAAGGAAITSTTSAADGTYMLTLTTGGTPLDGYLKGTSSGRLDTYLYPPRPLAADRTGATLLIINQQTLGLLGTLGGVTQDPAKGFVGLRVQDAAGNAVAGATVTIMPVGTAEILYAGANMIPDQNATATSTSGFVFIANTNVGQVTVDATMGATAFFEHSLNARAGAITTTAIEP